LIKQYIGVLFLALVMVMIQSALLPLLGTRLFVDFLFVMAVIIGLFKDRVHGAIMCFLIGGLEDLVAGQLPGVFMASRLTVFLAAQFARVRIAPDTPVAKFSLGLLMGLVDRAALYVLYQLFADISPALTARTAGLMVLGMLINAALVPVFYYLFKLIPGFIEQRRGPRVAG